VKVHHERLKSSKVWNSVRGAAAVSNRSRFPISSSVKNNAGATKLLHPQVEI